MESNSLPIAPDSPELAFTFVLPYLQVTAATSMSLERDCGEGKGFVEEMSSMAVRLHTRDQAKEGEKPTKSEEETPTAKWERTIFPFKIHHHMRNFIHSLQL